MKYALIGCGRIAVNHIKAALNNCLEIVAVCDVRPEQMERKDNADLNIEIQHETFEAHYNKYTNYLEMLDKEDLDYVDFAVPTYLHAKLAIQALETGHHVLSEKPMAMTVQECEQMIEASMRTGKTLMVAHCLRFWPAYEELKRIVDSGEWGAVVSAMFFRGGSTPMWSFEDWLRKKEKSGGYDAVSTNYFYPDGKVVNAMDDWTINGDFGLEMIFRVNFEKGCAVLTRDGLTLYPVGKPAVVPDLPADDGYYREMLYFQSCLRAGTAPERCTPLSTMETIRIAQAEQLSADRGGERVRL